MKKIFFNIVADKFYTNNTLFIYRECYYSNKKFIIFKSYGWLYENDCIWIKTSKNYNGIFSWNVTCFKWKYCTNNISNPLADPYIIGIASSATFGAVIAYLLKLPEFYYGVIAFISCMLSTLLIFKISKRGNKNRGKYFTYSWNYSFFILGGFTSFQSIW